MCMLLCCHHQGQRALKRQRSSFGGHTNGDLQFASPDGGPPDFHMRCREVLEKVYHEIGPKEDCYGVPAKDVFYKPVEETFPAAADLYYSKIARPMTLRAIEDRLIQRSYAVPQEFCDVSAAAVCQAAVAATRHQWVETQAAAVALAWHQWFSLGMCFIVMKCGRPDGPVPLITVNKKQEAAIPPLSHDRTADVSSCTAEQSTYS